jgi:ribosome maturation factor RimP
VAVDLEHVRQIAERVVAAHGLELWEMEFRGGGKARLLRLFIDRPGGVTHADCEAVSREVGTILDVEDVIPGGSYVLEVSSPGLDRKLVKAEHYQRFAGSRVRVMTREPVEGSRHFEGSLEGCQQGQVTLSVGGKKQAPRRLVIELANVEKAHVVPEF